MILKHIIKLTDTQFIKHKINSNFLFTSNPICYFAQLQKKRTQAPKTAPKQNKIDPKDINYNRIPQQYRKGVKAYNQATNMMVASQAQIEAISLKEIIIQQREKFIKSLESIDNETTKKQLKKNISKSQNAQESNPKDAPIQKTNSNNNNNEISHSNQQDINYYDFTKALKFMSHVSTSLLILNALGFVSLNSMQKYQYLGFFLGVSLNPSIIALTGISIGFNCASWIIRQSLHLQIKDVKQLTVDRISLIGCSNLMYAQGAGIIFQIAMLSGYLIGMGKSDYLITCFLFSQAHMIYNVVRATGGYRFEIFSKLLLSYMISCFFIGMLTIQLFDKINTCKSQELTEFNIDLIQNQIQKKGVLEKIQLKKGYDRFLTEFKTAQILVNKDQKINQLILQDSN